MKGINIAEEKRLFIAFLDHTRQQISDFPDCIETEQADQLNTILFLTDLQLHEYKLQLPPQVRTIKNNLVKKLDNVRRNGN